jgi:alpha-tubulin suppressor-like RCC1 family protein
MIGRMSAKGWTRFVSLTSVLAAACSEPAYSCGTEGASRSLDCECPAGTHEEPKPGSKTRLYCADDDDARPYTATDAKVADAGSQDARADAASEPVPDSSTPLMNEDDAGSVSACVPATESCNGKDDDCDDRVDEGSVCGGHHLSAGSTHTCFVQDDGSATCWGRNNDGQLGDGTEISRFLPVAIPTPAAAAIEAGVFHTCALSFEGGVSCWGRNDKGQLGDGLEIPAVGTDAIRKTPGAVALPGPAIDLALGAYHTCAVLDDGNVYCWGNNENRTLGTLLGAASSTPVKVPGLDARATSIVSGEDHLCVLLETRRVKCWGTNFASQLGDSSSAPRDTAVPVTSIANVVEIAAGGHHTCALIEGGDVRCWGYNPAHMPTIVWDPELVDSVKGAVHLGAGFAHDCAIMADGTVRCWGENMSGQLGDGTTDNRLIAVQVQGLAEAVEISMGGEHTCALTSAGIVNCWGLGGFGQLGDGTSMDRLTPIPVLFNP